MIVDKMRPTTWRRCPTKLVFIGLIFVLINDVDPSAGSKIIRTSAKSLAERAGAAQYAVHIEEELTSDEIGGKHDLKKRRTDNAFDDSDYEIYQGVVGRPGIDFPVLAGIPQTSFNCRKFGNGYFADLETDCQVFHICEGGKKISFLCPNGTIFQQTDLICDWWFRVNCNASPGHYVESAEVLTRAQNHRTSSKKTNHFNSDTELILGVANHQDSKSDRRLKSGHTFTLRSKEPLNLSEEVSDESLDFDEVIPPKKTFKPRGSKRGGRQEERNSKLVTQVQSSIHETQEAAETASFVGDKGNYNSGYLYQQPIHVPDIEPENTTQPAAKDLDAPKQDPEFNGYNYRQQTKKPKKLEPQNEYVKVSTTVPPITVPRRGTTTYKSHARQNNFNDQYSRSKESSFVDERTRSNTYTTARRIQTSRTTPYYTPTVPSIIQRPSTAQQSAQKSSFSDYNPTTESSPPSEHAIEMMRTLHELNLDTMPASNVEPYSDERASLVVPPSSGPDTLHSLALYFATAVDNLVAKQETTPKTEVRSEKSLDVSFGNVTKVTSTLVSNNTVNNYESLFGVSDKKQTNVTAGVDDRFAGEDTNDLDTDYSTNPVLAAAGSPQIRELAQVFTHALSAYLHDPSTFRRVLSEIRPTEPPSLRHNDDILSNRIGKTEDFNKGSGATYLPTQQMLTATPSSLVPATEDLEVLDFSDVTVSTLKKESFYPSTTPSSYSDSTTTGAFETELPTVSSHKSLNLTLPSADRVPASRLLTEQLEKTAQASLDARFAEESSETNNPIAMEINGGLIISTSFPYFQDDSLEVQNNTFEDNNYFPGDSTDHSTVPNQYGANFVTGAPVSNGWDKQPDSSLPAQWGSAVTADSSNIGTTAIPPSSLSFDLLPPNSNRQAFSLPIKDILPPNLDDNDLQHAQSQSLVASGNQLLRERERGGKQSAPSYATESATTPASISGHYITQTYTASPDHFSRSTLPDTGRISTSAWSTSYTVFLDPHTINDGLMNGHELNTVTPSPNTYLPKSTQTPSYSEQFTTENTQIDSRFGDSNVRQGKDYVAPLPEKSNDYMEVMQKKANEMFGNLNDTSASHLMNVMKKANKNKTVRKLILLLIQTCDDDYNTTVEESRTALLNALIGMDGHLIDEDSELQVITSPRRGKSIANRGSIKAYNSVTSTETPITTFRRPYFVASSTSEPQYLFESTSNLPIESFETTTLRDYDEYHTTRSNEDTNEFSTTSSYTTTDFSTNSPTTWAPTTTRRTPITTRITNAPLVNSKRLPPTSQSKRIAKDLDDLLGQASQSYDPAAFSNRANKYSDSRALDLLRSLYSLAGRFGRR